MASLKTTENGAPYDIPQEGSLGLLALGYRGLVAWRAVRGTDWMDHRKAEHETALECLKIEKEQEEAAVAKEDAASADIPETVPQEVLDGLNVVIVSGLPRSGTSMMMQMLTAGGLTAFTDGAREADESNPKGYYEHERVKALAKDSSWLPEADNLVVKMVAPLLRYLPAGPAYRIVFMERDIEEILQSQSTMLARDGRSSADREVLRRAYERQVAGAKAWIEHSKKANAVSIPYPNVLSSPSAVAANVNTFLGGTLSEAEMAGVVDPSLHRERT